MKKHSNKIAYLLIVAFLFTSCFKESRRCKEGVVFPLETQGGEGILAFYKDSKPWRVYGHYLEHLNEVETSYYGNTLTIGGRMDLDCKDVYIHQRFEFNFSNINSLGTYDLNLDSMNYCYLNTYGNNYYHAKSGHVTMTKVDTINKIVSGTFSFEFGSIANDEAPTVQISRGRFDAKFYN